MTKAVQETTLVISQKQWIECTQAIGDYTNMAA